MSTMSETGTIRARSSRSSRKPASACTAPRPSTRPGIAISSGRRSTSSRLPTRSRASLASRPWRSSTSAARSSASSAGTGSSPSSASPSAARSSGGACVAELVEEVRAFDAHADLFAVAERMLPEDSDQAMPARAAAAARTSASSLGEGGPLPRPPRLAGPRQLPLADDPGRHRAGRQAPGAPPRRRRLRGRGQAGAPGA